MEKDDNTYISFGTQMGDVNADKAVAPHLRKLRRLLDKFCNKIYCKEVDEFAPILRVDGDLWYWEFEGCEKLRLSKKYRYITIDVGMPRSRWEGITAIDIRKYLINQLNNALELMVKRLKKEKYDVNDSELWTDFAKVKEEFLLN
jgi:hypothetical protein